MTYSSVVIPLNHLDPRSFEGMRKEQFRCYPSAKLKAELIRVAGEGSVGLWWSTDEAIYAVCSDRYNWAWCPAGRIDVNSPSDQTNKLTHMRIFFRNPDHAVLFKLSWVKSD